MQPAHQNLSINPGSTYRDTVRLMQPVWAYRPITNAAGAPLRLNVPDHGLTTAWPIWVRGSTGLPDLNRTPPNQRPHRALFVDADMLEINALSAGGATVRGGELMYHPPVDLTGAAVVMRFVLGASTLFTLTADAGLDVSAGVIKRELTAQQTEQLVGDWRYSFEITFSDGSIQTFAVGSSTAASDCGGHAMPASSSEYYLMTAGEQGPPGGGSGGTAGVNRFNGRTGNVTLTGADVTQALGYVPATAAQGALAATAVQPAALALQLELKVDAQPGYGLSQANFTTDEKAKLAALEGSHYRGTFLSIVALEAALPTASPGDYADVDAGIGEPVRRYIWDENDSEWQGQAGSADQLTAAQVKALYESNPDTNAFTGAEKSKLVGIAPGATANPSTDSLAEGAGNLYHTDARARAAVGKGIAARTVNASGSITPADMGGIVASISDTPITLTISAEAAAAWLADGWATVDVLQLGAGAVTIAGDGFLVETHAEDTAVLDGTGAAASAVRRGADNWLLIGRMVAA